MSRKRRVVNCFINYNIGRQVTRDQTLITQNKLGGGGIRKVGVNNVEQSATVVAINGRYGNVESPVDAFTRAGVYYLAYYNGPWVCDVTRTDPLRAGQRRLAGRSRSGNEGNGNGILHQQPPSFLPPSLLTSTKCKEMNQ